MNREQTVRNLRNLCDRVDAGDPAAMQLSATIKARAARGDGKAKTLWAGLQFIYWTKKADDKLWGQAQNLYDRLLQGDPQSLRTVKGLCAAAKKRDNLAIQLCGRLKAIHGQSKPNALFPAGPGAPRFGGYGMPRFHNPGVMVAGNVVVGALTDSQVANLSAMFSRALAGSSESFAAPRQPLLEQYVPRASHGILSAAAQKQRKADLAAHRVAVTRLTQPSLNLGLWG